MLCRVSRAPFLRTMMHLRLRLQTGLSPRRPRQHVALPPTGRQPSLSRFAKTLRRHHRWWVTLSPQALRSSSRVKICRLCSERRTRLQTLYVLPRSMVQNSPALSRRLRSKLARSVRQIRSRWKEHRRHSCTSRRTTTAQLAVR